MDVRKVQRCEFWQDLNQIEKSKMLLNDGYMADCKFVVGPSKEESKTILGHKLMFVLESPVLEKLFNGNFSEGKSMPEVLIEDFCPRDFKNFCLLIYCHNAMTHEELFENYTLQEIIQIYHICHKYMVTSILKKCVHYFKSCINTKPMADLILLFEVAHALGDKVLLAAVEKAIKAKNTFFDRQLNELSLATFYEYICFLNALDQRPSEISMFNAILSYFTVNNLIDEENLKAGFKNMKEKDDEKSYPIKKFLHFVDFNKMTAAEFVQGPGVSEIFDWEAKYIMLSK